MSKELIYRFFGVAMMQKDLFLAMKRTSWLVTQWAYTAVIGFDVTNQNNAIDNISGCMFMLLADHFQIFEMGELRLLYLLYQ